LKLIGIGDNVVDYYQNRNLIYPGGNALNVAVMSSRSEIETAFLGIIGSDGPSSHIVSSLKKEGVDISKCRYVLGECDQTKVLIKDGDRVFVGANKETRISSLLRINLQKRDIEYINEYDLIHTSINSNIDTELNKIAHKPISYDFSDHSKWNKEIVATIAPYITYAFFSGANLSEKEIYNLFDFVRKYNVSVIGVTRGEKNAIFSISEEIFEQTPKPTRIVDTMGAGDSFIASFLVNYHLYENPKQALEEAAKSAAISCSHYGSIGYPLKV